MSGANAPSGDAPDTSALAGFDVFYRSTRDRIAIQIAALTGDPAEALDHVQEAFIRAWARWPRVSSLDDPEGWVRRVAYNLAVSRWRRSRRTVLRSRPPDRAIEWDDGQAEVVAALRTLPGQNARQSSCITSSASRWTRSRRRCAPRAAR